MLSFRRLVQSSLIAAFLALAPVASAANPGEFVRVKQEQLLVLLKQPESQARTKKVEALFDQMLDYASLAKESLGPHWETLTPEQRDEFTSVLRQLVRNSYQRNISKTAGYQVEFSGEEAKPEGVLVKSVARSRENKRKEPVSIDYLLHTVDGAWRVRDIVTEGSSLVRNYRQQFNRIIKKSGYTELIRRMKTKLDE